MASLEDALANQEIKNRGDRWIDPMKPRQSEVDCETLCISDLDMKWMKQDVCKKNGCKNDGS